MEVSIIWTAASWAAASASMMRPQTPARRQRTKRLWRVVYAPNISGRSRERRSGAQDPEDAIEDTTVVHTRGTPHGLFGGMGRRHGKLSPPRRMTIAGVRVTAPNEG